VIQGCIYYIICMNIFPKITILLFLAVFAANAQEYPNERISVYLHPVALLVGLDAKIPMIYSTVEVPFSLYNALIVKPSLWLSTDDTNKFYRVGSELGFRHYLDGRGEGMYLQPQIGAFYLSVNNIDFSWFGEDAREKNKESAMWYDFMGYFGYSYKFAYISIYSDTGIGYSCIAGDCSLVFDANFGIGFAF